MSLTHAVYDPGRPGRQATVVALHGWGASALDLLGLAPHLAAGECLVLCPQGPVEVPLGQGMNGYGWFPITMGAPPDLVAFERAHSALSGFLDEAMQRYPIAPDKVALIGFSQGGVMAYSLALRQPKRFAALAALSTWLIPSAAGADAGRVDGLPVLVQHGTRDELINVARGRDAIQALRELGAEVVYREYEMGHEINAASLRDLSAFIRTHLVSSLILP